MTLPLFSSGAGARSARLGCLRNDPIYLQLWVSLTATQQKALLALRRKGGGLMSAEVTRRYDIPVPTMQKALAARTKAII